MRNLALLIFLIATSCSGNNQNTQKLFDPNPEDTTAADNGIILNNCVMLDGDKIQISFNAEKKEIKDKIELQEMLAANLQNISRQKFYIIYANNVSTKKIINIINIIKAAKIENYRAIKLESLITFIEPK